jgi:hypothetical protein
MRVLARAIVVCWCMCKAGSRTGRAGLLVSREMATGKHIIFPESREEDVEREILVTAQIGAGCTPRRWGGVCSVGGSGDTLLLCVHLVGLY